MKGSWSVLMSGSFTPKYKIIELRRDPGSASSPAWDTRVGRGQEAGCREGSVQGGS